MTDADRGHLVVVADGAVRMWDARSRTALERLSHRPGRPVVAMSAAPAVSGKQPQGGAHLVVLHGGLTADVWWPAMPHGTMSTYMSENDLAAIGHRDLTAAAPSPVPRYRRWFTVFADRNGTLSRWQPYHSRLDHLPADPTHDPVAGVVVLSGPDGDAVVVTADRHTLRVWYPHRGAVGTVPLEVRARCLLGTGDTIIVGHDDGLLALSIGTFRGVGADPG